MKTIAFNFTKVLAERPKKFKTGYRMSTNISFLNIEKEENAQEKEDAELIRVSFNYSVVYEIENEAKGSENSGEVSLTGFIMLIASKKEAKDLLDAWEKKEIPNTFKVQLFNLILRKCSVRALQMEEEMGLPLHMPLPQVRVGKKDDKK